VLRLPLVAGNLFKTDRTLAALRKPEGLSGRWAGMMRRSCRSAATSTGRGACAFRGSNCLKWVQSGCLSQTGERQNSWCLGVGFDRKGWPDNFRIGCRHDRSWHRQGRELENRRPARKFPHKLVMRKPSERPAVYGSGCEGVPEAKRLAG